MDNNTANSGRRRRNKEAPRNSRGLRVFSLKVVEKIRSHVRTTYNNVAEELVAELSQQPGASCAKDGKSIRRRCYDAINVLLACELIRRDDKKHIVWQGKGDTDTAGLRAEVEGKRAEVERKQQALQELECKHHALQALLEFAEARDSKAGGSDSNDCSSCASCSNGRSRVQLTLPFTLIQAPGSADLRLHIAEDRSSVEFELAEPTLQIHEDGAVLMQLLHHQRQQQHQQQQQWQQQEAARLQQAERLSVNSVGGPASGGTGADAGRDGARAGPTALCGAAPAAPRLPYEVGVKEEPQQEQMQYGVVGAQGHHLEMPCYSGFGFAPTALEAAAAAAAAGPSDPLQYKDGSQVQLFVRTRPHPPSQQPTQQPTPEPEERSGGASTPQRGAPPAPGLMSPPSAPPPPVQHECASPSASLFPWSADDADTDPLGLGPGFGLSNDPMSTWGWACGLGAASPTKASPCRFLSGSPFRASPRPLMTGSPFKASSSPFLSASPFKASPGPFLSGSPFRASPSHYLLGSPFKAPNPYLPGLSRLGSGAPPAPEQVEKQM